MTIVLRAALGIAAALAISGAAQAGVIGSGTPASCTPNAVQSAVRAGVGAFTFDCGGAPLTIKLEQAIKIPAKAPGNTKKKRERPLSLDGGGLITFDGQHKTRAFEIRAAGFRSNAREIELRSIKIINAAAPLTGFVAKDEANPHCAYGYKGGRGGAIWVENAQLKLVVVEIHNSVAALIGPDTGGGAVFAGRSLGVTIIGSKFTGNRGANGGAIMLLQSDYTIVGSVFDNNHATGNEGNRAGFPECVGLGHNGQAGHGGNGAAVNADGRSIMVAIVRDTIFSRNAGNRTGAFHQTYNRRRGDTLFEQVRFVENRSGNNGGGLRIQDVNLTLRDVVFWKNSAADLGGGLSLGQGVEGSPGSTINVVGAVFAENSGGRGGGFHYEGPGIMENVLLWRNQKTESRFQGAAHIFGGGFTLKDSQVVEARGGAGCVIRKGLSVKNSFRWPADGAKCGNLKAKKVAFEERLIAAGVIGEPTKPPLPEIVKALFCTQTAEQWVWSSLTLGNHNYSRDLCKRE